MNRTPCSVEADAQEEYEYGSSEASLSRRAVTQLCVLVEYALYAVFVLVYYYFYASLLVLKLSITHLDPQRRS